MADEEYKAKLRHVKKTMSELGKVTIQTDLIHCIVGVEEIPHVEVPDKDEYVLISITEPGGEYISDETKSKYFDVCEVKFWDITSNIGQYSIISDDIAVKIKDFILQYRNKKFAIHCHAGISRSAAVGMAIECLLNHYGDRFIYTKTPNCINSHWRYLPNMTVFEKIIDCI